MSIEASKQLLREYYEQVVTTGAVERVEEFIAPDYVEVHDGTVHPVGQQRAREHILGVRRAYPDLRLTVEQQVAEGEWVVSRVLMRGTHAGEWLGIQPTGLPVEIRAVNVDRVVNGRIVEHGGAASMLEPLLGIGAVRAAGPSDAQARMRLAVYVNYRGRCEEAFRYYESHLGGRLTGIRRHGDQPNPALPADWADKVLHARMEIGGSVLLGADIPQAEPMRSAYLTLFLDSEGEAERVYAALREGGETFMEMAQTPFANRFAMLRDRFGASWMLLHQPEPA